MKRCMANRRVASGPIVQVQWRYLYPNSAINQHEITTVLWTSERCLNNRTVICIMSNCSFSEREWLVSSWLLPEIHPGTQLIVRVQRSSLVQNQHNDNGRPYYPISSRILQLFPSFYSVQPSVQCQFYRTSQRGGFSIWLSDKENRWVKLSVLPHRYTLSFPE
jgi:hypothetical protein